ncbi:MAG: 1-phosphofructokinase [Solirubrobacteraceae bacterium]|jgi:1-phosphofructokinase family hexose kinase|nr:1-phosphofructokinase [Solirubrobacteraceae bacterium]
MLIAGPNLTIDRTAAIGELRPGDVLRFEEVVVTPGGKGVNVARAALALGAPAVLVGLTPGRIGAAAAAMLADEGVDLAGIAVPGEIRSTTVVLERSGRVTVMNEPGPPLAPADWDRYEAAVADRLAGHRVLACSGSLPPGAPADAYARLAVRAAAAGVAAIVDVTGAHLAAALAAGADVVTPNLAEAEGLLHGRADETVEAGDAAQVRARAEAAAAELLSRGARRAVVTAGEAGAAFADGATTAWLPAPRVTVRNPVGAGDAFVGGLGVALERGRPFAAAVALAAAAAAASVETARAGTLDPDRAAALAAS